VQLKKNAVKLSDELQRNGYSMVTGGTDNHIVLWDVRPQDMTGAKLEKVFELVSISVNKNAIYGDTSGLNPGGIRLGTPAMTSRGLKEEDFAKVAEFLHRGMQIALAIQKETGKLLKNFLPAAENNAELKKLKEEVEAFAGNFFMPAQNREL